MADSKRYLKSKVNGVILFYDESLAKLPELEECDANGNPLYVAEPAIEIVVPRDFGADAAEPQTTKEEIIPKMATKRSKKVSLADAIEKVEKDEKEGK